MARRTVIGPVSRRRASRAPVRHYTRPPHSQPPLEFIGARGSRGREVRRFLSRGARSRRSDRGRGAKPRPRTRCESSKSPRREVVMLARPSRTARASGGSKFMPKEASSIGPPPLQPARDGRQRLGTPAASSAALRMRPRGGRGLELNGFLHGIVSHPKLAAVRALSEFGLQCQLLLRS